MPKLVETEILGADQLEQMRLIPAKADAVRGWIGSWLEKVNIPSVSLADKDALRDGLPETDFYQVDLPGQKGGVLLLAMARNVLAGGLTVVMGPDGEDPGAHMVSSVGELRRVRVWSGKGREVEYMLLGVQRRDPVAYTVAGRYPNYLLMVVEARTFESESQYTLSVLPNDVAVV